MLRAFANLAGRQVHFRQAGEGGVPLLMLHASPGSSRQVERLGDALASGRRVLAPDRPGNGDSQALPLAQPEIADYAEAELAFLDALEVPVCDVYGSHTGACVAVEMAIASPGRVRRVVLDGIGLFSPAETADYLAQYAPAMQPDLSGMSLTWAFQFCRDQSLFFPWFDKRRESARAVGLPPAPALHGLVVEVLKCLETYHLGYHASFRYPARERLPHLLQPVLAIASPDDPLRRHLDEAVRLIPHVVTQPVASLRDPGGLGKLAAMLAAFLNGGAEATPPT